MTQVRVLAGTSKGAFLLTSDASRDSWDVSGPHFAGWEIYHLKGSPADPDRIYVSQSSGWFGQLLQRSSDGGKTWEPVGNDFTYATEPGTHLWYDGTQRPFEFKRIWHLEPSPDDPDLVYAGAEDAAIFRSTDGGKSWRELTGLRTHPSASQWQPGTDGMCLHTIILQGPRIFAAISAAGTFRSDDYGETWQPVNRGLRSLGTMPQEEPETGFCVHHVEAAPGQPDTLYMQKHWDVMRSDDAGETWREISGNLPSDFGFPITVHPHEPETIYVVPMTSDELHFPPEGRLRVYRSRTGGDEWEPLTNGLPPANCYVDVYRDAMSVDSLGGIYFGTTGGQVYVSSDSGDSWAPIVRDLPPVLSVEAQVI
jgi:photosystem II stability/assembly factor-like uncharacterized protein